MRCKYHPDRQAEQFCVSCGIPLCRDCAEETRPGQYYCFQCAMLQSVSEVGSGILDKRERASEKKLKEKKKWGPFHYFVIASSVLILVMWGVILFGGQKPPASGVDFTSQPRLLLFMVDTSLKRYAYYEGNRYPSTLKNLIPKYLSFREKDLYLLDRLSYQRDSKMGYMLSLSKAVPGQMKITISSKGIAYEPPTDGGV